MALKHLLVAGVVATLSSFADAHSALLASGKLLGKLNSGECFNCAVGQYPVPSTIPASVVDPADPVDTLGAYIKSKGLTVKEVWAQFHEGTPYGKTTEPEAVKGTCGRYDPTAVGDIPSGADITYKKSNHNGPGEIWVDGVKTWFGENFITDGGSITADNFKCAKASCNVQWWWVGKVKVKGNWNYYQLYTQCFVVKGSGSGAAAPVADSDADETTPAPAAATKAPAASKATKAPKTSAPAVDDGDATPGTVTPAKPDASSSSEEDEKAAKKAAKEKRKAEKEAKKAAKKNKNLRSGSGSGSAAAAPTGDVVTGSGSDDYFA